ncbi:hypothetical protein BDW22DRAFT_439339 [Trametopsis cervina]|nr:hypothetical protein BDW22DRAFT_439339 [Trametopsis cervina]
MIKDLPGVGAHLVRLLLSVPSLSLSTRVSHNKITSTLLSCLEPLPRTISKFSREDHQPQSMEFLTARSPELKFWDSKPNR